MGALFFYDETVNAHDSKGGKSMCTVEVLDNHGVPEIRIGPEGEAHHGFMAMFHDWEQFERFVEAVNSLHFRLKGD